MSTANLITDIRSRIQPLALIECMGKALADWSQRKVDGENKVVCPQRQVISTSNGNSFISMPAYYGPGKVFVSKLLTNVPTGNPTIKGIVLAFSSINGELLGIIDGTELTGHRTAAASCAALKRLFVGKQPPRTIAIVGPGVQGRTHADYMLHCFPSIEKVRMLGRTQEKAQVCIDKLKTQWPRIEFSAEISGFTTPLHDCQVILTCTSGGQPVLHRRNVKNGTVVCGVGAHGPTQRECDDELMQASTSFADNEEAVTTCEGGDILQTKTPIVAEIGEIINQQDEIQPTQGRPILFHKNLGFAVLDAAAASAIVGRNNNSNL